MRNLSHLSSALALRERLTTSDYTDARSRGWMANASLWGRYVKTDTFRMEVFNTALRELAEEMNRSSEGAFAVADFGCGDGLFLDMINQKFPTVRRLGVDCCPTFNPAKKPICAPFMFVEADVELTGLVLECPVDVGFAVLSLIEMSQFATAIGNIASALRKNGVAIIVVLDPTFELFRFSEFKILQGGATAFEVDNELVIASHFSVDGIKSVEPYYRFIRPLDHYLAACIESQLSLESVTGINSGPLEAGQPRGVLIRARASRL